MHQEDHFQLLWEQKRPLNISNPDIHFIRFHCKCLILTVMKLLWTYQTRPSCQLIEVPWSPPADLGPLASCSAVDTNPHPRGLPGCPGSRPRRCQRGSWAPAPPWDEGIAPSVCTPIKRITQHQCLSPHLSPQVLMGCCGSKCKVITLGGSFTALLRFGLKTGLDLFPAWNTSCLNRMAASW